MKVTRKLREQVSSLSSGNAPGNYYDEVSHWWNRVNAMLSDAGFAPVTIECPMIYGDEGRCNVMLENTDIMLRFTWYRMPSFRWEIICYLA